MDNSETISKPWVAFSNKEKVEYMVKHDNAKDCTFVVGDGKLQKTEIFKAHKWILAESSEYFRSMLSGNWKEGQDQEPIPLDYVSPVVFEHVLYFIYHNEAENKLFDWSPPEKKISMLASSNLAELFLIADQFILTKLAKQTKDFLLRRLATANVVTKNENKIELNTVMSEFDFIQIFKAAFKTADDELLTKCKQAMKVKNFKVTLVANFKELDFPQFYELLLVMKEYVSMFELFNMIDNYSKVNCLEEVLSNVQVSQEDPNNENHTGADQIEEEEKEARMQKHYVTLMLELMDYTHMTAREFFEGPGQSSFLTIEDKYSTIQAIYTKYHDELQLGTRYSIRQPPIFY